jgi:hypothetical protein
MSDDDIDDDAASSDCRSHDRRHGHDRGRMSHHDIDDDAGKSDGGSRWQSMRREMADNDDKVQAAKVRLVKQEGVPVGSGSVEEGDSMARLLAWDAAAGGGKQDGAEKQASSSPEIEIEDWINNIRQQSERIAADTFKNITDGKADISDFQSRERRDVNPWAKNAKDDDQSVRKLLETWVKVEDEADSMKQAHKGGTSSTEQSAKEAYMLSEAARRDPLLMMEARHEKARKMRAERTIRQRLQEEERKQQLKATREKQNRKETRRPKQDIDEGRRLPWEAEERQNGSQSEEKSASLNKPEIGRPGMLSGKHGKKKGPRHSRDTTANPDLAQIQRFNREIKRRLEAEQADMQHLQAEQENLRKQSEEREEMQRKLQKAQQLKKQKRLEIANEKRIEAGRLAKHGAKRLYCATKPLLRKTALLHAFSGWTLFVKYTRAALEPARLALLKRCFQVLRHHSRHLSEKRRISNAYSRFNVIDRHWRAWAQWVKQRRLEREHAIIESQLKLRRKLEMMATGHFSRVLLQKCVVSWVRWVTRAQQRHQLELEKQGRLKRAQRLIEAVKRAPVEALPLEISSRSSRSLHSSSEKNGLEFPDPPPENKSSPDSLVQRGHNANSSAGRNEPSSGLLDNDSSSQASSRPSSSRRRGPSGVRATPASSKPSVRPPCTPKEIAGMKKREEERQQRRALLQTKYREKEEMKLRELKRREQEEQQRKMKEEHDRKDEVRKRKQELKRLEVDRERQRTIAQHANQLARMHYKKSLMIYFGLRPWKHLMRLRMLARKKAGNWFLDNSKQRFFSLWVYGVQRVKIKKLNAADAFYDQCLKQKCFHALKLLVKVQRRHLHRARRLCRNHRLKRHWEQWIELVKQNRLRVGIKMSVAQDFAVRMRKKEVLRRWRCNMKVWKEQAIAEMEKRQMRGQVDGWLKDYDSKPRSKRR